MPPREIVPTALGLLRARYVFPERAAKAATAIEARLAASEYDDLDEITLAERLTSQLYEICADKHLRVKLVGPRPHRPARASRASIRRRVRPARTGGADRPDRGSSTTSAFTASSGWTATSAISTCTGCRTRRTPAGPSPRPWNWCRERTR